MADHTRDRTYHNSALLLPDMRVLLGGHTPIAGHYGGANRDQGGPFGNNDNDPSFEMWSPPYLFRGERPTISRAEVGVAYGEKFVVGTPQADEIDSVLLMKTPSPQHINDPDQRSLALEFTKTEDNELEAVVPPTGNAAPPGFYYLVVNKKTDEGPVPSVARMVHVGTESDTSESIQPYADDAPAPVGGSATPDEDSSNVAAAQQRSSEAAKASPASVADVATNATDGTGDVYQQLSAAPVRNTRPASVPWLPMAAVTIAATTMFAGRRCLTARVIGQ